MNIKCGRRFPEHEMAFAENCLSEATRFFTMFGQDKFIWGACEIHAKRWIRRYPTLMEEIPPEELETILVLES